MTPERLVEAIDKRLSEKRGNFNVYWIKVTGERAEYARRIVECCGGTRLVPLIVREQPFDNPNSMLADLVALINTNREYIRNQYERDTQGESQSYNFVLLGRSDLCVTQSCSPVTLPEWFPCIGGRLIATFIDDVTWTGAAPLNTEESKIPEICEALYGLERILLERIEKVYRGNPSFVNAFLDFVRSKNAQHTETMRDILERAFEAQKKVRNPSAYRPSTRESSTLTARLWRLTNQNVPDKFLTFSKALSKALNLPEFEDSRVHESIFSVIGRPPGVISSSAVRFAYNILATVSSACRFVTAAAHSDDYCPYPITLLRSLSFDLRRALTTLTVDLSNLE